MGGIFGLTLPSPHDVVMDKQRGRGKYLPINALGPKKNPSAYCIIGKLGDNQKCCAASVWRLSSSVLSYRNLGLEEEFYEFH
jgi:hypothetical protein